MMKNVRIYRAQDTGSFQVNPITIRIEDPVPTAKDLPEMHSQFLDEARNLEKALFNALPGGTYDRLLAMMQMRKAALFVVPHADSPDDGEVKL